MCRHLRRKIEILEQIGIYISGEEIQRLQRLHSITAIDNAARSIILRHFDKSIA